MSVDPVGTSNFLHNSSSILAGSGILAGAALLWSHIKDIYNKISSVVICRATIDDNLYSYLRCYLRANYKVVPTNFVHFIGMMKPLEGLQYDALIPFKVIEKNWIYYNGSKFVYLKNDMIISIRGTVDFQKLICDAVDYYEKIYLSQIIKDGNINSNRFYIQKVIGRDKNNYSSAASIGDEHDDGSRKSDKKEIYIENLNLQFDKSFKYPVSYYMKDNKSNPLKSLYLDDDVIKYIEQAKMWFEKGDWYTERDIPWRLGWNLYGPGGTGKSSVAKAIAEMLGIPIYQYFLSTLSDQEYLHEYKNMRPPCIVLYEDFDNSFKGRIAQHKNMVSFDTILNTMSGVDTNNGIFTIITTNDINAIDPALGNIIEGDNSGLSTRPGRLDSIIKLGNMNKNNKYKLAKKILVDWPDLIDYAVNNYNDITPAQFQEICRQIAFNRIREEKLEKPFKFEKFAELVNIENERIN